MNQLINSPIILFIIIILSSGVLIKATHLCLSAIRALMHASGLSQFGIASFILAFATSIPELSVTISASFHGQGQLALGNISGSNIANLSLILGGAALIAGSLKATDSFIKEDIFYVFLAGTTPLMLLLDNHLSRLDGLFLLVVYIIYNFTVLRNNRQELAKRELNRSSRWHRLWVKISDPHLEWASLKLGISLVLILVSADIIVQAATLLATSLNLPTIVIGMIIIGVGTSLPELSFEIIAIKNKEVEMAFGNILGSVVTNSTLILGISALINPINLRETPLSHWIASLVFISIFALFWLLVWTKHRLERWEGALLVISYLIFASLQIGNAYVINLP